MGGKKPNLNTNFDCIISAIDLNTSKVLYIFIIHVQSSIALNQAFSLKEKYPLKIHKLYHKLKFDFIVVEFYTTFL